MLGKWRNKPIRRLPYSGAVLLVVALLFLLSAGVLADDDSCIMCHEELSQKKVLHDALGMGCTTCHGALEVEDVPHKVTGKVAKGLTAEEPGLCYDCHDRAPFTRDTVHAPLEMGCTGCHDPHSTDHAKLLRSAVPGLCFDCHEQSALQGAVAHAPVGEGDCLACHTPHSGQAKKLLVTSTPDLCYRCHQETDFTRPSIHLPVAMGLCGDCHLPHAGKEEFLLVKGTNTLCKGCHPAQATGRHITSGFRKQTHPVDKVDDPSRPNKKMSCVSCHAPHRADAPKLMLQRGGICKRCHDF